LNKGSICLIYITHAHIDHYAGANSIRAATGAPVAVHERDVEAMEAGESRLGTIRNWQWTAPWLPYVQRMVRVEPTPVDNVLQDGDAISYCGLDGEAIWTPGHTPGSSSLLVRNPVASHIFVGDLIANSSDPRIQRTYAQNWQELLPSVLKTLTFEPDYFHLGHGAQPLSLQQVLAMEIRGPAAGGAP
jgi:glyoxylase-like metal-dependent hydrolase (beta-lactamase superfamily II)